MCRKTIVPNTILPRMLAVVGIVLVLIGAECWSAEPTLAWLAFWVPPERMVEFETVYTARVIPVLETYGLKPSSSLGRKVPDGVFSRLWDIEMPGKLVEVRASLGRDTDWLDLMKKLGASFPATAVGESPPDSPIQWRFEIYTGYPQPAEGRVSPDIKTELAGRAKGRFRKYDASDGLPGGQINDIIQDQKGNLWFATYGSGVWRFDGHSMDNVDQKGRPRRRKRRLYPGRQR